MLKQHHSNKNENNAPQSNIATKPKIKIRIKTKINIRIETTPFKLKHVERTPFKLMSNLVLR